MSMGSHRSCKDQLSRISTLSQDLAVQRIKCPQHPFATFYTATTGLPCYFFKKSRLRTKTSKPKLPCVQQSIILQQGLMGRNMRPTSHCQTTHTMQEDRGAVGKCTVYAR